MKLLILDGNSVINRAYFGVRPLTTREGLYTHAIYGFLNILDRMEKEEQPDAVCVSFDLHGPTFRHKQYDGYKATRHGMPEELAQQMPVMKDVLRAMNIPIYECQGWEADDVIGTVGKICSNNGWECVIVTGDRDSLQLIDENVHVKLVISKAGQTTSTVYDCDKFYEEYGFQPKTLIDLKALMGDSSDNIPGVAGIGPKTAKELLQKFGSLNGVYENIDDASIRPKLREKLVADKDKAYLSYDLATIRPEAPIDFEPKDAIVQPYNREKLYELFVRLEFVRLIDKYGLRGAGKQAEKAISEFAPLPKCQEPPQSKEPCAVYVSPDGSLGIAWSSGVCALTPMEAQMCPDILAHRENCVCHDMKSIMHRLDEMGLAFGSFSFDTALAAYDLNPSQSDYPVSKLATNFLATTVDDEDAQACAEAIWHLKDALRGELEKLKAKHPIIPAIMDYRMLTKLKSTYADGLLKVIGEDGRIRTTFQNLVTATGRLSSTEPNLQNIPVRTDLGAEIRKMFVPREGCVLVDADYSQIELRVLAHIAEDATMQKAFINGMDIHTVTASQVFGVPAEEVTPLQRRHAKAVNFGIVYGISEFSLSEDLGVSRWEAKDYIDSYLANYKGVRTYMKQVVDDARESGFTVTMYGRKRYIPELKSSNFNIRSGAERIALNTPIQGTAADLIKLAMIRVDNALRSQYPEAQLILQVHDELIVECPEEIASQVAQLVSCEMEQVAALSVPLNADAKWGKSWYEAK